MRTPSIAVFFVLAAALGLGACQGCATTCAPGNCNGCCDSTGACVAGNTLASCGHGGNSCTACGTGLTCASGLCVSSGIGGGGGGAATGGGGGGSVSVTCTACTTGSDCATGAPCVQYAGSDFCGQPCTTNAQCAANESCLLTVDVTGAQQQVCIPNSGQCGATGCPATCPGGTVCNVIDGACESSGTGGGSGAGGGTGTGGGAADGGTCGQYDLEGTSSCCTSCQAGTGSCQANGCYGGWWCDRNTCRCHSPLVGACGGTGGGSGMGGGAGGGGGVVMYDGGVGPNGGSVSNLYFAVVGDTRPSLEDDTANYPTAIITQIYQDLAALNPPPQFVVTTGDFMFANPYKVQGEAQLQLYDGARANFPNIVFSAMGNHECTGGSATNCDGIVTNNLTSFLNHLVAPLGKTDPWYTVPINDTNGQWTAKIIITACNLWNTTQMNWLQTELNKPTTFTFVVRHMPVGSNGPCNADMDTMLASASYTGLLVGHTHSVYFSSSNKQLVEGVGGAPITSSANYGYALVQQNSNNTFTVTQHDYQTNAVVNTYTLP